MRDHLIRAWLDARRGRQVVNDEGHEKSPMRLSDELPDGWTMLPVNPLETRAGQYMRRLRRIENRARHDTDR